MVVECRGWLTSRSTADEGNIKITGYLGRYPLPCTSTIRKYMRQRVLQLLVVIAAVSVFTAFAVAPAAAQLGGSGDGINIGGDEGISVGSDGVNVGGEEGVDVEAGTDGVNATVGGDDAVGVEAGTDGAGVQVGGVEAGTDGAAVGDQEVSPGDGGDLPLPSDGGDIGGDGDTVPVGDDGSLPLPSDAGDVSDGGVPTDPTDISASEDDIPQELRILDQLLANAPATDQVGPEDLPVGDENAQVNICEPLDVGSGDLPAEALPSVQDLPQEALPSGVPTSILSNEAVLGIVLGLVPAPCEVQTPNDPSVDPTDPPSDPGYNFDVVRFGQYKDGGAALMTYDGTLNESGEGPGVSGMFGGLATSEFGDIDSELVVNDGEKDYGADPRLTYKNDSFEGEAVLMFFGKNAGVAGECNNLTEFDGDFSDIQENPLGPCEYELVGLPNAIGPADVISILAGATEGGLPGAPELGGGGLPTGSATSLTPGDLGL
jgi:hypothetical protein